VQKLATFEELEKYLRGFVNFRGDPVEYDFGGVVALMLALLNNLRERALPAELEDLPETLTEAEAQFLLRLAEYVRRRRGNG